MKKILNLICKILWKICGSWHDWELHFKDDLKELEKLIEALPDEEKLEDKLSGSEKRFLRKKRRVQILLQKTSKKDIYSVSNLRNHYI